MDSVKLIPPDVLRINDEGELYCADGQDVNQYLLNFRNSVEGDRDSSFSIVPRAYLERLIEAEMFLRSWCS